MSPSNLKALVNIVVQDRFRRNANPGSGADSLEAVMGWLCRAQDATEDGGVSEGFHLWHGWLPSYPETTGYIIETFLDYHGRTGNQEFRDRALRMADWLLSIQSKDGSIKDSYFKEKLVFDTGQVLFGLVRAYKETSLERFHLAAIRAADWLSTVQDADGAWTTHALYHRPHTYYSRVAWSLLALHSVAGSEDALQAARSNIDWVLEQQQANGWFSNSGFTADGNRHPFTHTIAYTVRGVLECGLYLQDERYIVAAQRTIEGLLPKVPASGSLAGTYDSNWQGDNKFSCLTGNAQFAIVLFRLYAHTGNREYLDAAFRLNRFLKNKQEFRSSRQEINGALAGSSPIWGKYIHYCYPNWAAKFFAETLMQERDAEVS